jgi:hypothetical protein
VAGVKNTVPSPLPITSNHSQFLEYAEATEGIICGEKFYQKCSGKVFNDDQKNQEKLTPTTNKEKKAHNIVGEETRQLTGRREVETADWVKEK